MINIGIIGCRGKLASDILKLVNQSADLQIIRAIASQNSPVVGKPLSSFTQYSKNPVIVENELLNCCDCDVLIDATCRDSFINENLDKYFILKKPLIIATTGFSMDDFIKINSLTDNMPVIQESNYSIELYYFIETLKNYVQHFNDIDITIIEEHHKQKRDKPSGTAIKIKDEFLKTNSNINIEILSVRAGIIHGEHRILFANDLGEEITFIHKATSRSAFADGIVKIIPCFVHKRNGLYKLKDVL